LFFLLCSFFLSFLRPSSSSLLQRQLVARSFLAFFPPIAFAFAFIHPSHEGNMQEALEWLRTRVAVQDVAASFWHSQPHRARSWHAAAPTRKGSV
jgi:hypothetical protein